MAIESRWFKDPISSMWYKLISQKRRERYGSPYKEYGRFNLEKDIFVENRLIKGGQHIGGFWHDKNSGLTLKEASKDPDCLETIQSLKEACKKFLDFCKKNKI